MPSYSPRGRVVYLFRRRYGKTGSPFHAGCWAREFTIEFQVETVDREYERLRQMAVPIVNPPTSYPWGRRAVWFRDPDGNIVNFYQVLE
jgi:catechol 2,3-dioxygenase-like lactoylglutathione lyase family enzyme